MLPADAPVRDLGPPAAAAVVVVVAVVDAAVVPALVAPADVVAAAAGAGVVAVVVGVLVRLGALLVLAGAVEVPVVDGFALVAVVVVVADWLC